MILDVQHLKDLQSELEPRATKLREEILRLEGEFRALGRLIDGAEPAPVDPSEPVKVPVTEEQPTDGEPTPAN